MIERWSENRAEQDVQLVVLQHLGGAEEEIFHARGMLGEVMGELALRLRFERLRAHQHISDAGFELLVHNSSAHTISQSIKNPRQSRWAPVREREPSDSVAG